MPVKTASKSSKAEVNYQNQPKGTQFCGRCTMFRKPETCTAVQGMIYRYGWCKLFEPKQEYHDRVD